MKIFFVLFLFLFNHIYAHEALNKNDLKLTKTEQQWIKNNPVINVQNEPDWAPFNYNQNNIPSGHSIDFIQLLASKVGLKINFIQGHSWKEYLEMLKTGELDVITNIAKTPQREQFYSYTSEYHKVLSSLYMREDHIGKYNSLKELEGKTISVVEGMVGESVLRKNYPKINIYPVKTSLDAIKAVVYGKADGVVQVNTLGNRLIQQYNITNIKPEFEIGDPKFNMNLHLATNKDNPILKDILEKGLSLISKNELDQLRKKHFTQKKKNLIELTQEEIDWLHANPNIKIGLPDFQQPLLIKDNSDIAGIFPDFLQLISKKLQTKFDIHLIGPKKNAQKPLSELNVDALLMIKHPKMEKSSASLYSNKFMTFSMVIASLDNKPIFDGLNDQDLKRLAIPAHSPLRSILKKNYPKIEQILVGGCEEGLNTLLTDKANGYVCNPHVIAHRLRSMGVSGIAITSITPYQLGFTLKTSDKNPILHSILNKAIDSLTTQEIQNIKKQWQQLELQKTPDYTQYLQIGILLLILSFLLTVWISWWNKRLQHEIQQKEIAQKDALEQERRLSTLLDNIPGMAYRAKNTPDWPLVEVNHAAYLLTGYHREDFINRSVLYNDIIVKDDQERIWKEVQTALNQKREYYVEYQIETKSGELKWVWERGKPIYSKTGELIWLEGLIVDNSAIKEVELSLKQEQNKVLQQKIMLESIFENSATFMVILNKDGDIIFFNSFAEQLSGYTKEQVLGKNWFEIFIPDSDQLDIQSIFADIMQNINMHNDNINSIISKEGKLHYIRWRNSIYTQGDQEYLLGVGTDITEELRLESLYKDLHESMQDAYGMIDLDGNLTDVNEMAVKLLGYTKDEFLNLTLQDITPKKWHRIDQEHHFELLRTKGCSEVFEKEFIHKDGSLIPVEVRICVIKNVTGDIEGFWGFVRDITERKKAEQEIKESEQKLRTLIDTIPDMVWMKDTGGIYKFANLKYQKFLELSESDIIGKSDYDLYEKKRADFYNTNDQLAIKAGKPRTNEEDAIYANGDITLLETVKAPVFDSSDQLIGVLGIGRDISELRKKEEMLITQSRSAAMGDMISMIAHQWKQPLAALSMIANNMKADYELETFEPKNIENYYSDIDIQVQHLATTIDDFRDFFKPNKTKQIVLVQNIIDDTLNMIGKSLENNNVTLIKDFEDVGEVSIFSNELFHILLNIINNAKEALVQRAIKDKKIFISTYKEDSKIYIAIEDNAGGIQEDLLEKIFEPYFTTKEAMNGTGIGLYMAKTIIEKHFMGKIEVQNTEQGAKFTLIIPQ